MNRLSKQLLIGAALVAMASPVAPALAQGYYHVPLQNYYSPYNYSPYGYGSGYGSYVDDYGYDPYYRSGRSSRVVKSTLTGAAIGAGAGAAYGLLSRHHGYRHSVLRPALVGAGVGAGIGLGYGLLSRPRNDYGYEYGY